MNSPALRKQHPYIYDAVEATWGSIECFRMLQNYISYEYTEDRGQRQGFSREVIKELFQLFAEHSSNHPELVFKDPWRGHA